MSLLNCRLCLNNSPEFLDIFSGAGLTKNIAHIIQLHFCLAAEINKNDLLSNKICNSCWIKTNTFHTFYLKVKKIQNEFLLHQSNIVYVKEEKMEQNHCEQFDPELLQSENHDKNSIKNLQINNEVDIKKEDDKYQLGCDRVENYYSDSHLEVNNTFSKDKVESIEEEDTLSDCSNKNNDTESISDVNEADTIEEERKFKEEEQIRQFFTMTCDLCSTEKFTSFNDAKYHYTDIHQVPKGYLICCKRKFKCLTTIREHIFWHTNPENFTCKPCNKIYADKRGLERHMLSHEPEENRPYKCDVCSKSFAKLYLMNLHKTTHTYSLMDKKFKCDKCGNGFPTQRFLNNHIRAVHEGVYTQTYVCDICAKVFKCKIKFNRHLNEIHLGIKPQKIQCKLCFSWLKNKHYFRRHMIRHEDESKEFICKFCGKKISNRDALRKHERYVHIMEPKFKCTYCDKAFKRAIGLKEHLTTHTGEILYTCMFCPKTFNSNSLMNLHKLKLHRNEWEEYKNDNSL